MNMDGIPEYLKVLEYDRLKRVEKTIENNLRLTKWYCPKCGIPYPVKDGIERKCDYCGCKLKRG